MDEVYKKILVLNDSEGGNLYRPSTFSHDVFQNLMYDIDNVKHKIEALVGKKIHVDGVQDASFIEQISVYRKAVIRERPNALVAEIAIPFSNFGRLTTIWSYDATFLEPYPLEEIINILTKHEFVYIPYEALQEPYDGRHKVSANFTWMDRFFSYI